MTKQTYGVAVKGGRFMATLTIGRQTFNIGDWHDNMKSAVLDIPEDKRGAYARWL